MANTEQMEEDQQKTTKIPPKDHQNTNRRLSIEKTDQQKTDQQSSLTED